MMYILKKIYYNTLLRSCNFFKNLLDGKWLLAISIPMCFLAFVYTFGYEDNRVGLNKCLDKAFYQEWKTTENGEAYINLYIRTNTGMAFNANDIAKQVEPRVKEHNEWVQTRRNNRAIGTYVKPNPQLDVKVNAYYTTNVEIDGRTTPTVWIISENTQVADPVKRKEVEKGKIKISE